MKRPLRNLVSLLVGDVGSRVIGFAIAVYLARALETSAFGVINIGLSVLGYLMLLASPGIQLLETRNAAAAQGANEDRVNTILSLRLVLSLALFVMASLAVWLIVASPIARQSIILFSVSMIPLALFLDWFFQGKEQFVAVTAAKLVNYITYGIVLFMLVRSAGDIVWVPVAFAFGNCAATATLFILYVRETRRFTFVWQPLEWKGVLLAGVPVGFAMVLAQSATNLPPIVIGWLASTSEAGVFSAAMKIIFVLLMFDRILNALLLPVAARYFSQRNDEAAFMLAVVTKIVLVVILPLTVCGILLSPLAIGLVFGDGYAEAAPVLQILMGYFLLTMLNSVFVCALVGGGREKEYTRAINVSSVVFIAGIILGTTGFGIKGAALGVVAGELATVVTMIVSTQKMVALPFLKFILRPIIACCIMVGCIVLLREQNIAIQIGSGVSAFVASLFMMRAVSAEEIRFLRERFV